MDESRQIAVIVAVGLILAVGGIFLTNTLKGIGFSGQAVVTKYEAYLYPDGTLKEGFTYAFTVEQYRMLYRDWEVPLLFTGEGSPYVQPVSIKPPEGSVAYVKDDYGQVTILTPGADKIGRAHV